MDVDDSNSISINELIAAMGLTDKPAEKAAAVLLFAADAITHQQRVAIWTRQPSSQTVYTAGSNAASSAAGSNAASSAWATNHSPFSSVTATSGQQANSTLALLTTPSDGSAGGFGTGGVSGGSGDDYGSGGFGGLPPLAFAYPAFSGGAISAAAELQWTLLLAAGMAAGNDALVQHVHDTFDLLALFKLYYSNGSNETRPLHHPGLEPALEEVMRQPPPLTLDHVQRLPRWPFPLASGARASRSLWSTASTSWRVVGRRVGCLLAGCCP